MNAELAKTQAELNLKAIAAVSERLLKVAPQLFALMLDQEARKLPVFIYG